MLTTLLVAVWGEKMTFCSTRPLEKHPDFAPVQLPSSTSLHVCGAAWSDRTGCRDRPEPNRAERVLLLELLGWRWHREGTAGSQ